MYNRELSRILYAFACFEKEVEYMEAVDTYRIRLTFLGEESEYILSKIRFLGIRIKVVENDKLQRRMHESATKALARYESGERVRM
jgi:predicted DNA-binding transcriptional regulator YafY